LSNEDQKRGSGRNSTIARNRLRREGRDSSFANCREGGNTAAIRQNLNGPSAIAAFREKKKKHKSSQRKSRFKHQKKKWGRGKREQRSAARRKGKRWQGGGQEKESLADGRGRCFAQRKRGRGRCRKRRSISFTVKGKRKVVEMSKRKGGQPQETRFPALRFKRNAQVVVEGCGEVVEAVVV